MGADLSLRHYLMNLFGGRRPTHEAVPTLRFPNRKPRFPPGGLSLVRQLLPHSTGMSGGPS